jgi:hypothetical protein
MFKPTRNAGLRLEQLGDMAVIIDLRRKQLHHINTTATVVWMLCDGLHSVDDIVAEIAVGCKDQTLVKRDVLLLLGQMTHNRLLKDSGVIVETDFTPAIQENVRLAAVYDESPSILSIASIES